MAQQPVGEFAGLLRRLRAEAGLTQEELAEAAGVSPRSVSDLERGVHRAARQDTARLLAGALGLAGPERAGFVAAARGHALAGEPEDGGLGGSAAVTRTLPRDVAAFTGRDAELEQLTGALAGAAAGGGVVGICAIGGMAGIGKTTLAVHAAHRLAERFPDGQLFLPLHAHTPGQRPVDPAEALVSLLLAAGLSARAIPPGLDARAACWRDHLADRKVLLVLDDAAGHEQVRPLLPGAGGSLVLVTSRRRLAALEDAAVISLDTLPPHEGAELLARLAGLPGRRAGDAAVAEIARLCGGLPLAIGMLARQLRHHPVWTPAVLATDLAAAQDRLELMQAENLSVAAAFGLSYKGLTSGQRRLFRRLGLHPGPDIDAHAAAALDGTSVAAARRGLGDLYDQYLLAEPARGRYRLHDLLREHARALAAADDPAVQEAATGRLLDYYLDTALAAGTHIPAWPLAEQPAPPSRPPGYAPPVTTPRQAIAWLQAEQANLPAAVGHAAASARPRHATLIPAAMFGFLDHSGRWDQALALLQTALPAARQAGDRPGQARTLMLLGQLHALGGDRATGAASLQQALELYRHLGDRAGQGSVFNCFGQLHALAGDYPAAAACLQQALELFRDLDHRAGQAEALSILGAVQEYTGDYAAAAAGLQRALELSPGKGDVLINLGAIQRLTGDYQAAAVNVRQAMARFRELGDLHRLSLARIALGAVQRLTGDYAAAAVSLQQALDVFRDLSARDLSVRDLHAAALNQLGLVQQRTGDYRAAAASHQQALGLSRDAGDRLGQADELNSLGELSYQTGASQQARGQHAQALAIARDLGAPLEEARALEGTGRCHLRDGHPGEGAACLRQALAIYRHLGAAPETRRVQETLHDQRVKNETNSLAPAPES